MECPKPFGGYPTPGLQTLNADTIMDKWFFMTENEWQQAKHESRYDFVIVGSGFCALAVAKRAFDTDPSCRILIIERGTYFLSSHFQNVGIPLDSTTCEYLKIFPWTMSSKTARGESGTIRFNHGMVPFVMVFVGGKSVIWSAWCPEPTIEEMHGWPNETKEAASRYFHSAKELLRVNTVDSIGSRSEGKQRLYGQLQSTIQQRLEKGKQIKGVYRTEAAPVAVGNDFAKYSVPAELLKLVSKHRKPVGEPDLDIAIVTNCIVEKIHQQDGTATALQTSRGTLALGDAKLILAMGTLPPTTLVRNSFTDIEAIQDTAGKRFGAHFISKITARVPRKHLLDPDKLDDFEMGAFYIAGKRKDYKQQYHIQLTAVSDKTSNKNGKKTLQYMPDVVNKVSEQQLTNSGDHVVFACAMLGELDVDNPDSWFKQNNDDADLTTNSKLQITEKKTDKETWDAMDDATFGILENVLSPEGPQAVEYWHGSKNQGRWTSQRPSAKERRRDMLVHESSTLHIGEELSAPVDTDYCLRGTTNVYVTGGSLWPRSASWNPTLTMVALAQHLADQLVEEKRTKANVIMHGNQSKS